MRYPAKKCAIPQFFFGDSKTLVYYDETGLFDIIRYDLIYQIINNKRKSAKSRSNVLWVMKAGISNRALNLYWEQEPVKVG
ncbi:hypothetical protein BA724_02115 [Domibacillus iocasae]|uniref:Transposase n=1 Tax=Domibacillus iocasae TaxID=1714016 RepID=A0A1E7DSH0_9BACI|nr:hypothetical protein BA724_02115 [Domibacillus iocasae]